MLSYSVYMFFGHWKTDFAVTFLFISIRVAGLVELKESCFSDFRLLVFPSFFFHLFLSVDARVDMLICIYWMPHTGCYRPSTYTHSHWVRVYSSSSAIGGLMQNFFNPFFPKKIKILFLSFQYRGCLHSWNSRVKKVFSKSWCLIVWSRSYYCNQVNALSLLWTSDSY